MKLNITITTLLLAMMSLIASAKNYCFALSPSLEKEDKRQVTEHLVEFLQTTRKGDSVIIIDGHTPRIISSFVHQEDSGKKRMKSWGKSFASLGVFLRAEANKDLHAGALHIPNLLDFIHAHLTSNGLAIDSLILIGSPLHHEKNETHFSMLENSAVPNDNHILSDRNSSIYGLKGKSNLLTKTQVLFVYSKNQQFVHARYKEALLRYYSLYFEAAGGQQLSSFGTDLATACKSARITKKVAPRYTLKPDSRGLFMVQYKARETTGMIIENSPPVQPKVVPAPPKPKVIPKAIPVEEATNRKETYKQMELSMDNLNKRQPKDTLGMNTRGYLTVGIRWSKEVDLDLFSAPQKKFNELSYKHRTEPFGKFWKDHTSATKSCEVVEFIKEVDLRDVVASVNLYAGKSRGGVTGEVVLFFTPSGSGEEYVFTSTFHISASSGNRGQDTAQRHSHKNWVILDVAKIAKLKPSQ